MKSNLLALVTAGIVGAWLVVPSSAQDRLRNATGSAAPGALVQNWLAQQDTNQDGRISDREATGLMKANFARNDANKDGFLDRQELDALAARLGRAAGAKAKKGNAAPQGRQQAMTTAQLMQRQTPDITIVPDLAYREGHDRAWKLDLVMPRERGDKPRPGIVFVHGGGWRSGDKRRGSFLDGALEYARKGYVCITINYRLIHEAPFPACIEDVKNAVRWFRAHAEKYNLDPGASVVTATPPARISFPSSVS